MSEPSTAASAQQVLGAAAGPAEVRTADGTVWRFGHPTQKSKPRIERLVAQHARAQLLNVGVAESVWLEKVQAGEYSVMGPGWLAVGRSPAFGVLVMQSLLQEHHPDVTPDEVKALAAAEPGQTQAAIAQVAPGFFALLLADAPIPREQKDAILAAAVAALTSAG